MTPLVLVLGANGSGKSLYAEALVRRMPPGRRIYIATMQPCGEEGRRRVEKHRAQRADGGYETVEAPYGLAALPAIQDAVVLLEDVSNLVANILFDTGGDAESALLEIQALQSRVRALVAVSIVMTQESGYTGETAAYIEAVNRVNAALIEQADTVIELVNGEAAVTKGALPW